MTGFPPPAISQGAGTLTTEWSDCQCAAPAVEINATIRAAQADVGDQRSGEDSDLTVRATARYNALSWGQVGVNAVSAGNVALYQTTGGKSTTTYTGANGSIATETLDSDHNESASSSVRFQGLRYTLRANFTRPWLGSQQVKFSWRERTINHTGDVHRILVTNAYTGDEISDTKTYGEAASVAYAELTETVSVMDDGAGGSYAETSLHTIEGTSLQMGDTVSITGPSDLAFLAPVFVGATYEQSASKRGFISYVVPDGGAGARPVYTLETASVVPNSPEGTPPYSGAQDAAAGTNGFAGLVPVKYRSIDYINHPPAENAPAPGQWQPTGALDLIDQAVSVSPTAVTWPGGLRMTLSTEDLTSRITGAVDAALAAYSLPEPDAESQGLVVAQRFLPAHEQQYTARKGVYAAQVYVPFFPGVVSLYASDGQPPPLISGGSLDLTWTQRTIDLDSGVVTPAGGPGASFGLLGLPGNSASIEKFTVTGGTVSNGQITGPAISVDAPGNNQRIEVIDLSCTGTLDCLDMGPQVQIVAGQS